MLKNYICEATICAHITTKDALLKTRSLLVSSLIILVLSFSAVAAVKYEDSEGRWLKIGARVQLQYRQVDPASGPSTDEMLFRRLRPHIKGSGGDDWAAKIQWDMGNSTIDLRDAYISHTGWDWGTLYIGNFYTPFSRESLTSSKKLQLVERSIVASHNFGVTDRQAGLHLEGNALGTITWAASLAKAAVDPDNSRVDFDTVVSLNSEDDWSEGELICGRVDYHPLGIMYRSQGDFDGDFKFTVGVAGYTWQNDGDNLDAERDKKDLDSATGLEVSGGLRGGGFSVDVEYGSITAELMESAITDGLYEDSETTIEHYAIKGGYMILPERIEIAAGYDSQDADGYETEWTSTSIGANYFVDKHNIKYQVTYRMGENAAGERGNDFDTLFVQAQYVF
jgi:phosphate-selective porin OprO/OprP